MELTQLLGPDRVALNDDAGTTLAKVDALTVLAEMLSNASGVPRENILHVLLEREALQSTGIGEGVAIPHAAMVDLNSQFASLLIVPSGVEFGAIDKLRVQILFAVIGPKRATGEHLKTLARVSRLLRDSNFRQSLIAAPNAAVLLDLILREEAGEPQPHAAR